MQTPGYEIQIARQRTKPHFDDLQEEHGGGRQHVRHPLELGLVASAPVPLEQVSEIGRIPAGSPQGDPERPDKAAALHAE